MAITATTVIQTKFGSYNVNYHEIGDSQYTSFSYGDITKGIPVVRLHSACLFGEAFHSLHCDCLHQLTETMRLIKDKGAGVIVYAYDEGRGIGLKGKIQSMELERIEKCDTYEAFKKLGYDKPDYRDFEKEVEVIKELNVSKEIISFSGNPEKKRILAKEGFVTVEEREVPSDSLSNLAKSEKEVKRDKMGYNYKED